MFFVLEKENKVIKFNKLKNFNSNNDDNNQNNEWKSLLFDSIKLKKIKQDLANYDLNQITPVQAFIKLNNLIKLVNKK